MDDKEDRLESVDLKPSENTEVMLLQVGAALHSGLIRAERLDEVEILMDVIIEYSSMVSIYGDKTDRIPESLAVDLNEAALLKRDELIEDVEKEWKIFASQFNDALHDIAEDMKIDLTRL
jgi:hypothetical protein